MLSEAKHLVFVEMETLPSAHTVPAKGATLVVYLSGG